MQKRFDEIFFLIPETEITFSFFLLQVVDGFDGVPDDILKQAAGYKAICIFVNKKIAPEQVEILKANENQVILCCSAG